MSSQVQPLSYPSIWIIMALEYIQKPNVQRNLVVSSAKGYVFRTARLGKPTWATGSTSFD